MTWMAVQRSLSLVWLVLFLTAVYLVDSRRPQRVYNAMYYATPAGILTAVMAIVCVARMQWLPALLWACLSGAAWWLAIEALDRWQRAIDR